MNTELNEAAEKGYQMTNGEYYTRLAWDETCKERDELKNQVKALSAIKSGLEKSLMQAFKQLEQKQVSTDEEIVTLSKKEYDKNSGEYEDEWEEGFIKGFESALQYSAGGAELLKEKDEQIKELKDQLRYVMANSVRSPF